MTRVYHKTEASVTCEVCANDKRAVLAVFSFSLRPKLAVTAFNYMLDDWSFLSELHRFSMQIDRLRSAVRPAEEFDNDIFE